MGFSVIPAVGGFDTFKSPTLKHSLNSSTNISIPSGTNMAYAIVYGGGSGGSGNGMHHQPHHSSHGSYSGVNGNVGTMAFGLTPAVTSVTVGSGGAGGNRINNAGGNGRNPGGTGGVSQYGTVVSGYALAQQNANATTSFDSNLQHSPQVKLSGSDGKFSGDGLNNTPNAGSGAGGVGDGTAGGSGGVVIFY